MNIVLLNSSNLLCKLQVNSSNVTNGELFNVDAFTGELDEVEQDMSNYRYRHTTVLYTRAYINTGLYIEIKH